MDRQNWYLRQLVEKENLAAVETVAQDGTNAAVALFNNRGIVSGMTVIQNGPDKTVIITAGTVVLENGTVVTTTAPRVVDLTAFTGAACVVDLYLVPSQSSDTPIITPLGDHIDYRLYDDFTVVAQLSTVSHTPIPATAFTGTLIGIVTIPGVVATIINAYISQATANRWVDVSTLLADIIALQRFSNHFTVASSAAPTFDATNGLSFEMTLTANTVLNPIVGLVAGDRLTVVLIQDGTGGRTFTWPAGVPGDIPDPTPNTISTFQFKKTTDGRIVNLGGMTVNT